MIPDDYKVDHLFLLVGSNPLPNYVAARLLLNQGGRPYFVHSTKTQPYAVALCDLLKADQCSMVDLGQDGETNSADVYGKMKQKTPGSGTIGLHYTGGTKVMSVHAYRAVREAAGQERKVIFSYLDSARLCLHIERGSNKPLPVDLRLKENYDLIGLDLDTLWRLHRISLNLQKPGYSQPHLDKVAEMIAYLYGQGQRAEWTGFTDRLNRTTTFAAQSPLAPVAALAQLGYMSIRDLGECVFSKYISPKTGKYDPIGGALRWLQSDWLEDHTLDAVRRSELFTDARCGVETLSSTTSPQFEVDVVALRGYQLFLFSCTTTDNDGKCKEKLFEAALRARRLGGDEARFALVCPFWREENGEIYTGEKIKNELSELLDRATYTVFDRSALNSLPKRIKQWAERLA